MHFPNINIIRENSIYNAIFFSYLFILFDSYLHISSYLTNCLVFNFKIYVKNTKINNIFSLP